MAEESDLLRQILDELRAQKSMSGAGKGLDELEEGLGQSTEALKANEKAQREAAEAAAKFKANMESALKNITGALGSFGSAISNVTGKFSDFGQGLDSLGDAALDVGKNFGMLGMGIGLAVKAITSVTNAALKQSDALLAAKSELSKLGGAGVGTAKDIGELAHQSKISSKNLQMLVEPMKSLSGNFLALGTTVGEGQKKFMQMTAVTEEQRKAFGRLGLSQQDLMQSQADFVKLQRSSGIYMRAQEKDARKLQQASLEYTENLVKLAAISGQDLEGAKKAQELVNMQNAENIRTTQESIKIRKLEEQAAKETDPVRKKRLLEEAKSIEVEQKARKEMLAQVAAQTDEATALAYAQYMATGQINDTVAPLIRQGNDLAEQRRRIQAAAGDENKMREATAKNMTDLNKNYEKTIMGIGSAAQQSDQVMKDWGISTTRNARFVEQQGRNEKDARDKAATDVANQMKKGTDPMADAQQTMLETQRSVAVGLDELLLKVNPLTKEYGLAMIAVGALTAAVVTATMAFKGLQGGGGLFKRLLGGAGAGAGGAATSGAGAGGAAAGGGIGNAIGNIGQGAGRGLEGLLKGAAGGLQSFANPMVVAGAAGMGAAITVIGAGIAGATWLMGKALPTLAEGFEAFTEIDGDKLLATGKGVGALGAGLAVFGVGGAAAGFGAIAQSIGDGLLSFFGGKTPFQRIEEFSKLDINAEKVKNNAEAFAAFGGAMTKVGAAGAAQGIGSAVGAIGGALGSLMGAQSPLEQLQEFSEYDLGPNGYIKVKQNADAMVAFGNAMSAYQGSGQSTLGKLGDSVAAYFQVKPPIEQMKEFMSIDLGEEGATKVKNNAEAFTAFANAMAAYQGAASGGLSEAWGKKISEWFQLKPPVEQMQDFAKVKITKEQVDQVKLNAEAFGAFAGAMASYQGGANTGVMEGLSDWVQMKLELASPMQKLEAFSKIKLSEDAVKQVKLNADAFVAFSNAMQQYKGSASEGLIESGFNFVKKALGGDSSAVFKKFEEFTKLDVDPDKAQKVAQAFMQYAIAMAAFKDSNEAKQALKQATSQAVSGLAGSPAASTASAPAAASAPPRPAPTKTSAPAAAPAASQAQSSAGGGGVSGMFNRVASFLGFGGDKGADAKPTGTGDTTMASGKKGGPGGSMSDADIKNMIKQHEGVRYEPYRDSLGLWTVGVGHLIGDGRSLPAAWNRKFSEEEVNALFDKDYEKHKRQAQSNVPGFNKYDSLGQAAFIDLTFNMGPGWPNKFKNTSKKIEMGDTSGAARGLEDSLWYRQVASRGPKIVSMVENSKVKARDGGIASGPDSGFPATLHGKEMIVPLSGDSLLEKLGSMSADALKNETSDSAQKMETLIQSMAEMNQRSTSEWINRLDKVIDVLENSRTTQEKTLRVIRT